MSHSTPARGTAGLACIALGLFAVVTGLDARRWGTTLGEGDLRVRVAPAAADPWPAADRLPGAPARRLLGVDDDLAYRRALRLFALTQPAVRERLGPGFVAPTAAARVGLRRLESTAGDPSRRSDAANLLAVLALQGGAYVGTGIERSTRLLRDAVRLDGANDAAKRNLELLLERLGPPPPRDRGAGGAGNRRVDTQGSARGKVGRGF